MRIRSNQYVIRHHAFAAGPSLCIRIMHTAGKSHPPHIYPKYSWRYRTIKPAQLYYFTNHHEANAVLACLPHGPIGFDLEWRPNFSKGQPENRVALVQLATADTVILLHIHHMTRTCFPLAPYFPLTLFQNFQSNWRSYSTRPSGSRQASASNVRNHLEGMASTYSLHISSGDCEKLWRDYGVSVRNCVELSLLARTVDNARWKGSYTNPLGLARLVETYEQATLLKGKIQRSNWERYLTVLQQECKFTCWIPCVTSNSILTAVSRCRK